MQHRHVTESWRNDRSLRTPAIQSGTKRLILTTSRAPESGVLENDALSTPVHQALRTG